MGGSAARLPSQQQSPWHAGVQGLSGGGAGEHTCSGAALPVLGCAQGPPSSSGEQSLGSNPPPPLIN